MLTDLPVRRAGGLTGQWRRLMPGAHWIRGRNHRTETRSPNGFPQHHRHGIHIATQQVIESQRHPPPHVLLLNDNCSQTAAMDKGGIGERTLKTTGTLKSDTISRVIYLQLSVPPLLEEQRTDVSLALMKKTTNRRWGSIVWGVFDDDIAHRRVHMSRLRLREYYL